jgi:hypothetical protein
VDLLKYPIEKLFHFIASIVPGFVALLIFEFSSPGSFDWFLDNDSLGYTTKVTLILVVAFVVGYSLSTFLNGLIGAIYGAIGARFPAKYQAPSTIEVAPWRDRRWRTVLKKHLGSQAPNDTILMSKDSFESRRKMFEVVVEPLRSMKISELELEKLSVEIDDGKWAEWYDHYHQQIATEVRNDLVALMRNDLNFNLEVTGVYLLVSAAIVPGLKHWWYFAFAIGWILIGIAQSLAGWQRYRNKWMTLTDQIRYLSDTAPPDSAKGASA